MPPARSERLSLAVNALARNWNDLEVQAPVQKIFGTPVEVTRTHVGEPGPKSERLRFPNGCDLVLRDDVVAAVVVRIGSSSTKSDGADLSEWISGVSSLATLDELKQVLGRSPRAFGRDWYFMLGGSDERDACLRFRFDPVVRWKKAGGLTALVVTLERPGDSPLPDDDDCPTCSGLLTRSASGQVDVGPSVEALASGIDTGNLTESAYWVPLRDLQALHASGLMERVESQLTCRSCRRTMCLTLFTDGPPTFVYAVGDAARRRPMAAIPPVEEWADEARIAEVHGAMRYVDHEPGAWFLVEEQGLLYLDVRVSLGVADTTSLIQLDDSELAAYRAGGHDYVTKLARSVSNSPPQHEHSNFQERDLYSRSGSQALREAVSRAIVNHTWLADQRRKLHP